MDAALLRRAAKQLTEEGVSHVLATVDATQERELATKYDVRSVRISGLMQISVEVTVSVLNLAG